MELGPSEQINKTKGYRLLEALPGSLMILTYVLLFGLSFIKPVWVIYFIILYAFLWLVRVGYFVTYLFIAWKKYRTEAKTDWLAKTQQIGDWDKIYHAIFLPHWKEPYGVLETALNAIANSKYPRDKMIIILGGEERDMKGWEERRAKIETQFGNTFYKLILTTHPKDLPDEVVGKGANAHYMARQFHKILDEELHIPYENIIVSNFDCDTAPHPQYFARLAHAYLTHPNPTRASYQPLALYNNNLWESPSFTRVVANSTSFWLMTELARPEQFMTFSSHSMSWKALVDVGYWQKDIVTEDSRIFLQCFMRYDGEYYLEPIFIPINMDTVDVGDLWQTAVNQYKQLRRWAWSAEHQAYLIHYFRRNKKIKKWEKIKYTWKLIEGQLSWATAPVLLLVFTRLPLYVARHDTSVLIQNAPFVIETILQIAMVGMVASAFFNIQLLPGKPPKHVIYKYFTIVLQWFLLPITLIIFGTLPAIDAQIRLLLGKHLVFWNTEKERVKT